MCGGASPPRESGEQTGEDGAASMFRVAAGRVSYYARFDGLPNAPAQAGLNEADRA